MGMVMYLRRATPEEIETLKATPKDADAFVFRDAEEEGPSSLIEFDKAWHALHFTLSGQIYGSVKPLGIIAGEDVPPLGEAVLGEVPHWVIEPAVMAEFADALDRLSDEAIVARFDPAALVEADVYLADAFADEDDSVIEYLMQGVPALRRFATLCRENGEGAIRSLA